MRHEHPPECTINGQLVLLMAAMQYGKWQLCTLPKLAATGLMCPANGCLHDGGAACCMTLGQPGICARRCAAIKGHWDTCHHPEMEKRWLPMQPQGKMNSKFKSGRALITQP